VSAGVLRVSSHPALQELSRIAVVAASLPAALARQRPWGLNRVGEAVDVAVLAWLDERRKEHFAALTTWAQWFLRRPQDVTGGAAA
jgi:hypothetical protein